MEEITHAEILNAMALGIVRVTKDPTNSKTDPYGVVCSIAPLDKDGNPIAIARQWFWFTGLEGEECTVRDYLQGHPLEDIVNKIHATLSSFQKDSDICEEIKDEWEYYRACIPILPKR